GIVQRIQSGLCRDRAVGLGDFSVQPALWVPLAVQSLPSVAVDTEYGFSLDGIDIVLGQVGTAAADRHQVPGHLRLHVAADECGLPLQLALADTSVQAHIPTA